MVGQRSARRLLLRSVRDEVTHGVRTLRNINLPGDGKERRSLQSTGEEGRRTGRGDGRTTLLGESRDAQYPVCCREVKEDGSGI